MPGARFKPALALLATAALILSGTSAAAQNQGQGMSNAQPRCGLVVESSGGDQWIIHHDPLASSQAVKQFDLEVVNRGDGPCTGVASVDLRGDPFGLAKEGETTRLPYSFIGEDGPIDLTPRTGQNQRRSESRPFNLRPGEREILRFTFSVNVTDALAAGLYSQTVYLGITHPNGSPWAERPITLGLRVASTALIGLKGEFTRSGGVANINLGALVEGDRSLNTTLYVLSTSGYSISISSANGGRLRQGQTEWYIPYSLGVGDRRIDLSRPSQLDVVSMRRRFDDYPLSVTIGSTADQRAGDYSDTVTFTVAAI